MMQAFKGLDDNYNLKVNIKKCEILRMKTNQRIDIKSIEGIEVKSAVRYLGLNLVEDRKRQIKEVQKQIKRNIGFLKWRMRFADTRVAEQLINSFGRSLLIYLGTPMVAGGLWKKDDIEKLEKAIIKETMMVPQNINSDIITNLVRNTRPAA